MQTYGLGDWTFRFNRGIRMHGQCIVCYETVQHFRITGEVKVLGKCIIELSKHYVEGLEPTEENVLCMIDTIKHEIAHALTPGHHHDHVFQAKCREIGCSSATSKKTNRKKPEYKWTTTCSHCNHTYGMYRKPKRNYGYSCSLCGTSLSPFEPVGK